jgi:hypothetical protein
MSYDEAMMSWLAGEERRLGISPDDLLNDPLLKELRDGNDRDLAVAIQRWRAILLEAKREAQPVITALSNHKDPPQVRSLGYDPIQVAVLLAKISYIVHGVWTVLRKDGKSKDLSSPDKIIDILRETVDVVKSVLKEQGVEVRSEIDIILLVLYLYDLLRRWWHSPPTSLPEPSASPPEVTDAPSAELSSASASEPPAGQSEAPNTTTRSG